MNKPKPSTETSKNTSQSKSNKRKDPPQPDAGSKNGEKNSDTGTRGAKRPKVHEIRSIAAQKSHAALKDGELNVQSFVDESMRRTRTSQTSRAFQRVPFRMRRRAAAHNYKKREMVEDNTPTVNSSTRKPKTTKARLRAETAQKLGILAKRKKLQKLKNSGADKQAISIKTSRPKIRRNFRKRQVSKTWLPTHLWHAKRARMTPPTEPLWRFAIPLTPTQKVYRPTHRIQWEKGAMAWDMSYMSTISLSGAQNSVQNVLKALGLAQEALWNDKARRWRSGSMHWTGIISRKIEGGVQTIGPATIIWNPEGNADNTEQRKGFRQLYIRIHPSAFLEAFNEILRLAKGQNPRPYVEDLRFEIGSIDITGPDSTEALLGVLKPYFSKPESKEQHASKFETLAGLKDPGALPLGTLLAFSVADPRLCYPPRRVALPKASDQNAQIALLEAVSSFRKEEAITPYQLFNRDMRFKASKLPSQRSLNRRRTKGAPGIVLEPTAVDPSIPIILLASRHSTDSESSGTWTLMLPWKCVPPIWYSLMHYPLSTGGNPWFGGLDEIRHVAFERGLPWFPGDLLATDAGKTWELEERKVRHRAWDRMPKAKRVNWDSLDLGAGRKGEIGVGWNCDYETLFDLRNTSDSNDMSVDEKEDRDKKPPLPADSLESITQLTKSTFGTYQLPTSKPPPPASLVTVRIKVLGRGGVTTCARIYRLPDIKRIAESTQAEVPATDPPHPKGEYRLPANLRDQWLARKPSGGKTTKKVVVKQDMDQETRQRLLAQQLIGPPGAFPPPPPNSENIQGHPLCPDKEDLIGFVTTGCFNLRDGRGEAIGNLSATKTLEELKRYKNDPAARLCVVRDAGQNIGWLGKWELI
ncbi:POPLD-domain-containing protein [Hypoxylon trugodes]|uniref:POPLD-domain-containing protein n=1 Tax=Hypoxylon trugodes TaxID=326681 RepID=UPI0021962139|nr:POPLD-domain-containing protein [Hypoxylon trugodes]KAI1392163.1 POPLD-domain-containing protein [Hypoxylon trugodes]